MRYESIIGKKGGETVEGELDPDDYDFDQEQEGQIKPRRKVFLMDNVDDEDDEIEDRYYSDKSSEYESDDFTDTARNIELLKRVKLERLRTMERLEAPDRKKYKSDEEYQKAVKDFKESSFTDTFYDEQGNVYIKDRLRSGPDGKSFLGRKKNNRVFVSTMCPNEERMNELREISKNYEKRRGRPSYKDVKYEDLYNGEMPAVKYEDGENIYLGSDYSHTKGNSKIFDVKHQPKKPDPLQKFKDRIQQKQQSRDAKAAEKENNSSSSNNNSKSKSVGKETNSVKKPSPPSLKPSLKKHSEKESSNSVSKSSIEKSKLSKKPYCQTIN